MGFTLTATPTQSATQSGQRKPSYLEEDLIKDASGFETTYTFDNVTAQGDWASFTPDWNPSGDPPSADFAYCIYKFDLTGYDRSPTVKFIWHTPPSDFANLWIGMGHFSKSTWDWYEGPADNVLTLDSFDPYISGSGTTLIAVVLLGQDQAILEVLIIDEPELRGTGEFELVIESCPPPLDPGRPLPAAVDLRAGCAPVNDQGWWESCTAFAVGDSAYNYDLGAIYSDLGWDLQDPFNRISPKYLYIESGKDLGNSSPYEGRYTGSVVAWLAGNGVATELNAPYDYSTNDNWTPDALADVPLLTAEDWFCMNASGSDGLTNIKTVLANHGRPVIMRVNIDQGFLNYIAGEVWHYTGPTVGSHAMCFVGYDDAADGGGGAFLTRNSWGPDWGDAGYMWISYDLIWADDAEPWVWKLEDEYDSLTALRFCGQQVTLEPPTRLSASEGTFLNWVRLDWTRSPGATGYNIYRDTQTTPVMTVGDVDTWDDTGITNQKAHSYWIEATAGPSVSNLSAPDLGWLPWSPTVYQHSWGGTGAENGRDIAVDTNGNVYLAGSTDSFGEGLGDFLLCKYNSIGVLQWAKTWGGTAYEYATAITIDGSNNLYVTGSTLSFGEGDNDFVMLKYNSAGTLLMQRTWGGSDEDRAFGITVDGDGNIYLVGNTESFGLGSQALAGVVLDSAGTISYQATWSGSGSESASDIAFDAEGNVYLCGYTDSFGEGGRDVLLLQYDSTGALQWAKTWGGGDNDQAQAMAIYGSDIYLAGFTSSYGEGNSDVLMAHYNTSGVFQSAFTWGEAEFDGAYGIAVDSSGNLFLCGQTYSFGSGDLDLLLLRLTAGTDLAYQRTWGGSGNDWANRIRADSNDLLYIAAGSPDATADWQDVVGQSDNPLGISNEPTGTVGTPTGIVNTPVGAVNSPSGTSDSGGGSDDALVLKLFP